MEQFKTFDPAKDQAELVDQSALEQYVKFMDESIKRSQRNHQKAVQSISQIIFK